MAESDHNNITPEKQGLFHTRSKEVLTVILNGGTFTPMNDHAESRRGNSRRHAPARRHGARARRRRGRPAGARGRRVLRRRRALHALSRRRSPTDWSSATRCDARGTTPVSACGPAKRCARPRWIRSPAGGWSAGRHGLRAREAARTAARRAAAARRSTPASVVIIGGGGAGLAAADMLRREGYDGPITMLSADDAPPSDRPNLSKDYLAGQAQDDWIPLRPPEYFTEQRIELVLGRARRRRSTSTGGRLLLEDGARRPFGALLIATGADPVRLPIPGADSSQVHYLRSFADSRAIVDKARSARHVGGRRRELHRSRSGGVAAGARHRRRRRRAGRTCRSSASWARRSAASFRRCTKRTASSSISGRR